MYIKTKIGEDQMARMHSRKKGKSGSNKIYSHDDHSWVESSGDEITGMIVQMKKEGLSNAVIGVKLRDQYGIPGTKTVIGKKIGTVLSEAGVAPEVPEDLMNLINKYKNVSRHVELNKKDASNTRNMSLIMAKILRLVRYYKSNGTLPEEWKLRKVL